MPPLTSPPCCLAAALAAALTLAAGPARACPAEELLLQTLREVATARGLATGMPRGGELLRRLDRADKNLRQLLADCRREERPARAPAAQVSVSAGGPHGRHRGLHGGEAVHAPPPPPLARVRPDLMPPDAFARLLATVKAQDFEEGRLGVVRSAAGTNGFIAAQVVRLLGTFTFGAAKLKALRLLAPQILDPHNGFLILNAFTFSADKAQARKILARTPAP